MYLSLSAKWALLAKKNREGNTHFVPFSVRPEEVLPPHLEIDASACLCNVHVMLKDCLNFETTYPGCYNHKSVTQG